MIRYNCATQNQPSEQFNSGRLNLLDDRGELIHRVKVRDLQGIEIDPNYSQAVIEEHFVDFNRLPPGLETGSRGNCSTNKHGEWVHENLKVKVVVRVKGVTYRMDCISDACHRFGNWVRRSLKGEDQSRHDRWAMTEEVWNELESVIGP